MKPIPLNSTPDLSMAQITNKLFNNEFLSDISFSVGGQIIHAHSYELMKRSRVFEKQLQNTMFEKKFIPFDTVKYESFYQFLRFIYTDKCDIDNGIALELLKLAISYKVTKLENQVIDHLSCDDMSLLLKLFEFCIQEDYALVLDKVTSSIASNFELILASPTFETIQPKTIESLLRLDHIDGGVNEVQVFNGLMRWIDRYCKEHNLNLCEHKEQFQDFLNLVRFSAMSDEEIFKCVRDNSNIFSDRQLALFYKRIMPNGMKDMGSISQVSYTRKVFCSRLREISFDGITSFSTKFTKFSVSKRLLLAGVRFGTSCMKNFEIEILSTNLIGSTLISIDEAVKLEKFNCANGDVLNDYYDDDINDCVIFNITLQKNWGSCCLSLGDSIEVKPFMEYTVKINFTNCETAEGSYILGPRANEHILVNNNVKEFVRLLESGPNMIEIFFKPL